MLFLSTHTLRSGGRCREFGVGRKVCRRVHFSGRRKTRTWADLRILRFEAFQVEVVSPGQQHETDDKRGHRVDRGHT